MSLNVVSMKVDDLVPYPGNPRRGNVDLIKESLLAHGQFRPLVVQASTRHVLAGNHTLEAAVSLGWTEIDAVLLDVDDRKAAKIVLADNRTSDAAYNDTAALSAILELLEGDFEGTGYLVTDLDALLMGIPDMDLEELAENVGAPDPRDLWPSLSMRVSADVYKAWKDHSQSYGNDSNEALASLLGVTPES